MLMERYTVIKMATVDDQGRIADGIKLFSSFDSGTATLEPKKYNGEHFVIAERYDGRDRPYVEDSEISD